MKHFYKLSRTGDRWPEREEVVNLIVRASSEQSARELAATAAGPEGREIWMNPEHSLCVVLPQEGNSGVICREIRC